MTKRGFKSVTIPESLHNILSSEAQKQGISIGKYLEERVLEIKPLAPEAHVLSGLYYEPAKYIIPDTIAPEMVAKRLTPLFER